MVNNENKKPTMPSIEQVLNAIRQRDMFSGFQRYQYTKPGWYDLDNAMKIIEAIGKSRNPAFVIDDENRFAFENFIKWAHCDTSMKCLDPVSGQVIPGRLKRGIYIAGNTGTGKTWCMEIMQAYIKPSESRFYGIPTTTRARCIGAQYAPMVCVTCGRNPATFSNTRPRRCLPFKTLATNRRKRFTWATVLMWCVTSSNTGVICTPK